MYALFVVMFDDVMCIPQGQADVSVFSILLQEGVRLIHGMAMSGRSQGLATPPPPPPPKLYPPAFMAF